MTSRLQQRRDTAANWSTNNPVLAAGEIGITTDTKLVKIGDGSTAWNSLSYGGLQGLQGTSGPQGTAGFVGSNGSQGATGLQGIQGIQGTTGLQGLTGTGVQGSTGAQGTTGVAASGGSIPDILMLGGM